ncbi:MAG: hypothetical protein ACK4GN_03135 [Runella sp.]
MKFLKYSSLLLAIGIFFAACKTEMIERLPEFSLEQGGYMRTVTPFPVSATTFSVSRANMSGTRMEAVLEAVTPEKGARFASYDLSVRFVDATPANGNNSTQVVALRSIPASAYTKDAQTGYPRHTLIITGTELLTATRVTTDQISNGDRFEVTATMKLTDGRAFNASNTGVNITGGAFYSSPFFYRINVVN